MSIEQELIEAERAGWQALTTPSGAEYYDANLTDNARMAFSFGVMSRPDAIGALAAAEPWSEFEISDPQVVRLTDDSGVLAYRVQARRDGDDPYCAVVSSTFVRMDGTWRLAFHQQTPA